MALVAVLIIVFAIALPTLLLIAQSVRHRVKEEPPQPPSWPLLGHLPLLSRSKQPLHRLLSSLAEKYGPIMHLQLGIRPVLVISSSYLAKECFTINDKAFASRPLISAAKHIGYNSKILGFAPYGSYWRNIRKICTLQLFTPQRIESFRHIRTEEISCLVRSLLGGSQGGANVPVKIKPRLSDLTFNIIVRMVASKRFSPDVGSDDFEVQQFKEVIEKTVLLVGSFDLGNYLPFLKFVDPNGMVSMMKTLHKKREIFMKKLLREHREKRRAHARDFIDVLISATENHEIASDNNDDVVNATALTMINAGTETSSVTIEWALSALLNHPHILEKAQKELDTHVGRDRLMEESDVHNLKYLQAIVKETLRLYPAVPLLVPHESIESCTVGGYHIPAGTQLFVNAWAIHRDSGIWDCPTEFIPERFLNGDKEVDVKGHDFELIPFGTGRRMCPGMSLALTVVSHTLGRLLQSFEWFVPQGTELIDMREGLGLTMPKLIPLEAIVKPRLPLHLYR